MMQMKIDLCYEIYFLNLVGALSSQQVTELYLHVGQNDLHLVAASGIGIGIGIACVACSHDAASLLYGAGPETGSDCAMMSSIVWTRKWKGSAEVGALVLVQVAVHLVHVVRSYRHCREPWVRHVGHREIEIAVQV